jgi:hypothetical protein
VNYIVVPRDGRSVIESVSCVVCNGKGVIVAPETETPGPDDSGELWPILIPLAIFLLFFLFLWL